MTGSGDTIFRVDPSMYGMRSDHERLVCEDFERLSSQNLQFHFSGLICAQRWLDVCQDPEYGHRDLVAGITSSMPEFIARMRDRTESQRRFSLVSLGPGDGAVDDHILRHLDRTVPVASYLGFDFSFELLCIAVQRVASADCYRQRFPRRAVCGDLNTQDGSAWADGNDETVRLFSLTGFSLGNFAENVLLSRIRTWMRTGDYLFLDAHTHEYGPIAARTDRMRNPNLKELRKYTNPTNNRFAFGPLEVATRATVDDVDIGWDLGRTLTTVPHAINIVVHCAELNTTMRFTGRPVRHGRVDLATTTLYRYEDLEGWLVQAGFDLIHAKRHADMAFFLLQRDDRSP